MYDFDVKHRNLNMAPPVLFFKLECLFIINFFTDVLKKYSHLNQSTL